MNPAKRGFGFSSSLERRASLRPFWIRGPDRLNGRVAVGCGLGPVNEGRSVSRPGGGLEEIGVNSGLQLLADHIKGDLLG